MKTRIDQTTEDVARLYDNLPIGVCVLDRDLRYTYANQRLAEIHGRSIEHILGRSVHDVVPEFAEELEPHLRAVMESGESLRDVVAHARLPAQQGRVGEWIYHFNPLKSQEGTAAGVCCTVQEMSASLRRGLGIDNPLRNEFDAALISEADALRENDRRIHLIADAIPAYVSYLDREKRYCYVNKYYEEQFGIRQQEIVGRHVWEILGRETYQAILPRIEAVLAGNRVDFEATIRNKEDEARILNAQYVPDFAEDGQVRGYIFMATDITERKRTEDALRASEEMRRSITDSSLDHIVMISPDAVIQYINRTITDYSIEEVVGTSLYQYIGEDFQQSTAECLQRVMETGRPGRFEVDYPCTAEQIYSFEARVNPIMQEGAVAAMIINAHDVTDRKRAEQEIRNHARQQAAVAGLGLRALAGVDWPVLMNEAVEMLADILNVEFAKVMELLPDVERLLFRAVSGWDEQWVGQRSLPFGETSQAGLTLKFGEPVVVEDLKNDSRFTLTPALKAYGVTSGMTVVVQGRTSPYGILGVHSRARRSFSADDISFLQAVANVLAESIERAQTLQSLRNSESRFQTLARISPVGIFRAEASGEWVYVNERYCQITGMQPEETLGQGWVNALHEEDRERIVKRWNQTVGSNRRFHEEYCFSSTKNDLTWVIGQAVPDIDSQGWVVGYVGTITDITGRRLLEQEAQDQRDQLIHISRLNTMGEMASGLAHELNQPLAAVAMYAESCILKLKNGPAAEGEISLILETIRDLTIRAGEIIHRLREFVRKKPYVNETLHVEELINDVQVLLEWELRKETISLSTEFDGHLPAIRGDRIQLQQVLINLIRNAVEAVEESGGTHCRIEVRAHTSAAGVAVQVRDNGPAIPEEDLDQIFETFFTTKPEGMGLGLAICRSIIEAHAGHISAQNNADGGLTFEFTLPRA